MKYPIDWTKDEQVKRLFIYQTKTGLAPKYGTLPIGWYQGWQCRVYDAIMNIVNLIPCKAADIKCKMEKYLLIQKIKRFISIQ